MGEKEEKIMVLDEALDEIRAREFDMTNYGHIGALLRDEYHIPSVTSLTGMRLARYLGEDPRVRQLSALKRRIDDIKDHRVTHKKDHPAKRAQVRLHVQHEKLAKLIAKKPFRASSPAI